MLSVYRDECEIMICCGEVEVCACVHIDPAVIEEGSRLIVCSAVLV